MMVVGLRVVIAGAQVEVLAVDAVSYSTLHPGARPCQNSLALVERD